MNQLGRDITICTANLASVSKTKHAKIQEIEGESTSLDMVKDGESHNAQTHVDDSCKIANMVIYALVNPGKIPNEDEAANLEACDGEVAIEEVSGLVIPTEIVDEGNEETTHEVV